MIVERTGDLVTSDCPGLGHGVNTLGSMAPAPMAGTAACMRAEHRRELQSPPEQ